jgi:hypothetical protein
MVTKPDFSPIVCVVVGFKDKCTPVTGGDTQYYTIYHNCAKNYQMTKF